MQGDKKVSAGYFRLDPSQSPPAIDISPSRIPDRDKVARGIYTFDEKTLKLAVGVIGEERPTDFRSPAGTDHVVFTLRRAQR